MTRECMFCLRPTPPRKWWQRKARVCSDEDNMCFSLYVQRLHNTAFNWSQDIMGEQ